MTSQDNKIKEIENISELVQLYRADSKKVVLCHGNFDLLHIGHIRYFEQAARLGDILVVTVTPDKYVDKGPFRPAFTETLRAEAVASLNCVDFVAINKWPTAEETLRLIKPDIYVKGADFKNSSSDPTGKLLKEEQVVNEIGARLVFTKDIVFSSTNLINRFLSNFSEDVRQYLSLFKSRYSINDVLSVFEKMTNLKVLVIGDTILDDYHYCHTLGISSKDPALALQYESNDLFAGGVLAVGNHLSNFVNEVKVITILGEKNSYEKFIRSKLNNNVLLHFFVQDNAPTIIKRRFIEGHSLNKLFEVYIMNDKGLSAKKEIQLCNYLKQEAYQYDLIVAADFGHGTITPKVRKLLAKTDKFLSVNTQANAGNRGFHTISCYDRADYVSISEGEVRLEMRDTKKDIKPMINILKDKLKSRYFAVTLGKKGCLIKNQHNRFVEVPSFAPKVVDRIGAGDAFFSLTSLAAYLNTSLEIIGFIGNVAGGLAVETLGNQKAVDKKSAEKYITSLMK